MKSTTNALLRTSVGATIGLVLCGLVSLAIWVAALSVPAESEHLRDRVFMLRTAIPDGPDAGLMSLLFVPYGVGYMIASRRNVRGARPVISAFSLLACIALVAKVVPIASHDIYLYVFHGRALALHGANPYAVLPAQIADPFVPLMGTWLSHLKNTYGPLWTSLSVAVVGVIGDRPDGLLVAFKAVTAAFFLGCIPLLSRLSAAIDATRPSAARDGLMLLFAWNPALLFEFAGNGHNDSVMIFFLLLAVLLAVKGRFPLAGAALAASFLTKYITLLCLPFFIAYAISLGGARFRERARNTLGVLLPIIAATIVAYAPYWIGPATLNGLFEQASLFSVVTSGPLPFSLTLLFGGSGRIFDPSVEDFAASVNPDLVASLSSVAFFIAFLACIAAAFSRALKPKDFVRFVFAPLICYLAMASLWLMPWYLSWIVPLLILEGAAVAVAITSVASLLLYITYFTGPVLGAAVVVIAAVPVVKTSLRRVAGFFRRRVSAGS